MRLRAPGFLFLLWTLVSVDAIAQPSTPGRGVLTDPVVSHSDPSLRYVLYVPERTDPDRAMPVLFIMDYRGRGRVAADLFRPAAERLGWIIASSYDSASDGAGEPNVAAVKAMLRDVSAALPVDDHRLYLAGLSGTARMATLIAARSGVDFRGVIGAAAGFHPDVPPSKATKFLYYGTAGSVDYNYWEMRALEDRLTALGLPHRVAFFDGPHGWMPPELAASALYWMELRAMEAGQGAVHPALVDERWARDRERSEMLERDGAVWQASRLLAAMAADYAGLRSAADIEAVSRRASELGATRDAQAQAQAEARAMRQHDTRVDRALQIVGAAYPKNANEPAATLGATILDLDVVRLRRLASQPNEAGLGAARVLAELNVQTGFYLPSAAIAAGDDVRAGFYLGIAEAIDPSDSFAWYLRAVVAARAGQATAALRALDRAVTLGFRTADALQRERAFDRLRTRVEFAALLDRLTATRAGS